MYVKQSDLEVGHSGIHDIYWPKLWVAYSQKVTVEEMQDQ